MPHIAIQMYPGRDAATKQRLAKALVETAARELSRSEEHFSVSITDIPQDAWKASVYDKVVASADTVIQPGYTM
ncbi:MAG TPA: 4-oxalocrotonate tautomerase family enzyme [Treponema sp.]|nr:4-oxalocrotonate tautomerase family enzyme [Treponema sp.]